jgi:hypothetical protein
MAIVCVFVGVGTAVGSTGSTGPSATCGPISQAQRFLQGAPSRALLSLLGVLRRPSHYKLSNVLDPVVLDEFAFEGLMVRTQIFVDDIRLVHDQSGAGYYLVPSISTWCTGRRPSTEGVAIFGPGGGGGEATATRIEQGQALVIASNFAHSTIGMLVPDGVASVTLRYPAGVVGGFNRHHAQAFTLTRAVSENFVVLTVPRKSGRLSDDMTMLWRATDGQIVKTFATI